MKTFVYTIAVVINIVTLCYGSPLKLVKHDTTGLHVPAQNPDLQSPAKVAETQHAEGEPQPLVIKTYEKESHLVIDKTKNATETANKTKNATEIANHVEKVKPLNSSVTTEPSAANDLQVVQQIPGKPPGDFNVGALKRGSLVFLGLCVIVLGCYAWKTYRIRKNNSSPVVVHKYGVRANRSDIEMRPLPLDDEEDDDTLFEIGNSSTIRQ